MIKDQPYEEPDAGKPHVRFCEGRALRGVRLLDPAKKEWSKMVHSCNNRPIGMSVDEWCRENSITTANYYYRMTQVRKACLDSLSDEAVNQEVSFS